MNPSSNWKNLLAICFIICKAWIGCAFVQHSHRPTYQTKPPHNCNLSKINHEHDLVDHKVQAYPQQTPHSGRHFLPSHPAYQPKSRLKRFARKIVNPLRRHSNRIKDKRFMEGWYYRITLPEEKVSFAFIFSIEDPNPLRDGNGELSLSAVQVMGPNDEYVVQADKDHRKFWAWQGSQALGCVFEYNDEHDENQNLEVITPQDFDKKVKTGFQMLPSRLQGKVDGHDGSLGGVLENEGMPRSCDFDMTIRPLSGWGDDDVVESHQAEGTKSKSIQKSTAGWLASYSVFEPHWQVTMADARATGHATWNGKRYDFEDVPFYAGKYLWKFYFMYTIIVYDSSTHKTLNRKKLGWFVSF